jgi:hypothetical protein
VRPARAPLVALLVASGTAFAAGGHHAVDDAALLEPSQCELETWASHSRDERLAHGGASCRAGAVELGLGFERSLQGPGATRSATAQVKVAGEFGGGFSAGASLSPFTRTGANRESGATLLLLATRSGARWAAHLNAGMDFVRHAGSAARAGAALEWTASPAWAAVGEWYLERGNRFARAGLRWKPSDAWDVDISRTAALGGDSAPLWTLGANFRFQRR